MPWLQSYNARGQLCSNEKTGKVRFPSTDMVLTSAAATCQLPSFVTQIGAQMHSANIRLFVCTGTGTTSLGMPTEYKEMDTRADIGARCAAVVSDLASLSKQLVANSYSMSPTASHLTSKAAYT